MIYTTGEGSLQQHCKPNVTIVKCDLKIAVLPHTITAYAIQHAASTTWKEVSTQMTLFLRASVREMTAKNLTQ